MIRHYSQKLREKSGHKALPASGGEEALQIYGQQGMICRMIQAEGLLGDTVVGPEAATHTDSGKGIWERL